MPRSLNKPAWPRRAGAAGVLAAGLLVAALAGPAAGQGPPAPRQPAPAAAPAAPATAAYPGRHADIWATTVQYVYADDPALTSIQQDLLLTVDGASVKAVGRGLEDAVRIERERIPNQTHVLKLQGIFKDIEGQKPATLPALVEAIRVRLESNPERMQSPARRERLSAFLAQLRQAAAAPAAPFPDRLEPADAAGLPGGTAALAPAGSPADTAARPPAPTPSPVANPPAAPVAASSPLPMISLVLSALSLLGVLYLLLTRTKSRSGAARSAASTGTSRRSADFGFSASQYEELRKLVRTEVAAALAGNVKTDSQLVDSFSTDNQPRPAAPTVLAAAVPAAPAPSAAAAPAAAPASPLSLSELVAAETTEPAVASTLPAPAPAPTPQLRTIYVNQQPLDGAFRRDNLADAPASYTIFEITVDAQTPDQGTFVVTRNEAAHGGYIGSHHSILEPASVYSYPQGAVSRIITDVPGTVQRLASGDWQIQQKAQIHFA